MLLSHIQLLCLHLTRAYTFDVTSWRFVECVFVLAANPDDPEDQWRASDTRGFAICIRMAPVTKTTSRIFAANRLPPPDKSSTSKVRSSNCCSL